MQGLGFQTHPIYGEVKKVIGAIGDKRLVKTYSISHMDGVEDIVPIMSLYKLVGARSMQNFRLLGECGKSGKPVLLKRGLSVTIEGRMTSSVYIY